MLISAFDKYFIAALRYVIEPLDHINLTCMCNFRLGSTCNHVTALLLFKVDYAWKNGLMQGHVKPCTSDQNMWATPALRSLEPMKTSDMVSE